MLLINTTLEFLPDQLSSTLKNEIQCLVDIQVSLRIHYLVILLVHFVFLYIDIFFILAFAVAFLTSPYLRYLIRIVWPYIRPSSRAPEERHSYIFQLFTKEMSSTFVYVLCAFLYKWFGLTNNDSPIRSLNFYRWIVEGSFAPYLFCGIFFPYYIAYSSMVFDQYQSLNIIAITTKVPVYFFMRCAESKPDFFLNRFESYLIILFCEPDSKRKIFFKLLKCINKRIPC